MGAFGYSPLKAAGVANLVHTALEAQEYYTDVLFHTHNVRGAWDVVNDLSVGVLAAFIYAVAYVLIKRERKLLKRE